MGDSGDLMGLLFETEVNLSPRSIASSGLALSGSCLSRYVCLIQDGETLDEDAKRLAASLKSSALGTQAAPVSGLHHH